MTTPPIIVDCADCGALIDVPAAAYARAEWYCDVCGFETPALCAAMERPGAANTTPGMVAEKDDSATPPVYPPLGSVSSGTLRSADLVPAFLDVLTRYAPERAGALAVAYAQLSLDTEGDATSYILERLFNALDDIAPPYTMFGSHPGNMAKFGYWPDLDALADAVDHDATVVAVDTLPDFVAHTNAAGNLTLYAVTLTNVWSSV
jgi:hypothetical protein